MVRVARGIGNGPVQVANVRGQYGARLFGAESDDKAGVFESYVVYALGIMAGDVDSQLGHHLYGFGSHLGWDAPGALHSHSLWGH